jgi:hypothetical protein
MKSFFFGLLNETVNKLFSIHAKNKTVKKNVFQYTIHEISYFVLFHSKRNDWRNDFLFCLLNGFFFFRSIRATVNESGLFRDCYPRLTALSTRIVI